MHIVIFAGGTLRPGQAFEKTMATADLIIAADSGAENALHYGYTPSIIVGDFDSLQLPTQERLKSSSQLIRAAVEKDETDTELALQLALDHGADQITILGGIGGQRFDHTMANILLLAGFTSIPIRIIDGPSISWLLKGPASTQIVGKPGDLLSLLPLTGEATGLRTTNLYYPLHDEILRFGRPRGVSNILTHEQAEVSLEHGLLLIVHTSKQELVE